MRLDPFIGRLIAAALGVRAVIFALLALEELGRHIAGSAVAVITVTALLSVLVRGAIADPLATPT